MPENPWSGKRVKGGAVAAVALAALSVAASARAGTASLQVTPGPCDIVCSKYNGMPAPQAHFKFDAGPAEANAVTLSLQGTTVTIADTSAPLTAGMNCTRVDDHTATCSASTGPADYTINLGNGGDDFRVATSLGGGAVSAHIKGGTGNDTITGNDESDTIDGGGGVDRISAGAGDDTISAGDGSTIDGGPGEDTLDYSNRTAGVNVDLAAGTGSGGTRITGIEDVFGGSGNDVIIGDAGPNKFYGGAGDDRLIGGAGNDTLNGGPGRDFLSGGPGNDELETLDNDFFTAGTSDAAFLAREGVNDTVTCGPGQDVVRDQREGPPDPEYGQTMPYDVGPDPSDVLAPDCERVVLDAGFGVDGSAVRAQPLRHTSRTLVFAPPCRCTGRLDVTSPSGGRVGSARFTKHTRRIAVHARGTVPGVIRLRWSAGTHSGGWSLSL